MVRYPVDDSAGTLPNRYAKAQLGLRMLLSLQAQRRAWRKPLSERTRCGDTPNHLNCFRTLNLWRREL
jgi:hypothetical protein